MKYTLGLFALTLVTSASFSALLAEHDCTVDSTQNCSNDTSGCTITCNKPSSAYYPGSSDKVTSVALGTSSDCHYLTKNTHGSEWLCSFSNIDNYCLTSDETALCIASISNKREPTITDKPTLVNGKIQSKNLNIPTNQHGVGMY